MIDIGLSYPSSKNKGLLFFDDQKHHYYARRQQLQTNYYNEQLSGHVKFDCTCCDERHFSNLSWSAAARRSNICDDGGSRFSSCRNFDSCLSFICPYVCLFWGSKKGVAPEKHGGNAWAGHPNNKYSSSLTHLAGVKKVYRFWMNLPQQWQWLCMCLDNKKSCRGNLLCKLQSQFDFYV